MWLWGQWQRLDNKMDAALAQYEAWGIKVDFMNRNDQEMVDWYHKVPEKAAAHYIMVDLHGAYPPNGLPFADAGGFRQAQRYRAPFVQTTRGQAVGHVVYDSPDAYKNTDGTWGDGAEFIQGVPTTWDETHVLQGDIRQYIVTARRKGYIWYIGAMTNEAARTIEVPLSCRGQGAYNARVPQDGADVNHLAASDVAVDSGKSLTLVPSGGAVAVIKPQGKGRKKIKAVMK